MMNFPKPYPFKLNAADRNIKWFWWFSSHKQQKKNFVLFLCLRRQINPMKKVSVFFLMLLLSFLFFLGQSTKPQVEGKSVFPLFANNGDFVFLFEKEDKGIALGKQKNPWQNEVQQEILLVEGIASSPSLKRDKQKRMWAIWEGQDSVRMNVYLAYLEGDRLKCKEKVNKK